MLTKIQKQSIEDQIVQCDCAIILDDSLPNNQRTTETARDRAWNIAQKERLAQMLFLGIVTYTF